ncbi:MAG: DUF86 domain-containing protein [Bacteroidales bacterium]|nr:DUF86 domain-containing protein [Bacteroidales bacterium]
MREPARDKGRLRDILTAAGNVKEFTQGLSFDGFISDKLRYFAILKNVEIVGEAAYMLSKEYIAAHPDIPWKKMIRMRHVLVHGYSAVLPEILWETAIHDLPSLYPIIEGLLNNTEAPSDNTESASSPDEIPGQSQA